MPELVTFEIEENIGLIGLNRPSKRNAMNEALITQLRDVLMEANDKIDAAVLFGHGPNFSAGLDLAELALRLTPGSEAPRRRRPRHHWHATFDLLARGNFPVVCALHGATIGGGLELASAAHIRVADETTFFGLPEGQRGIFVGGGGSVRTQRIVGYPMMADMMLTGRTLSAEEGRQCGLAQYITPAGGAFEKAKELAKCIAGNVPQTNWMIMNVLPRVNDLSHDDGLFMEYLNSSMARPPESLKRLNDFLEKRATPLGRPK